MNIRKVMEEKVASIAYGRTILNTPRILLSSFIAFGFNIAYAIFCGIYGCIAKSFWFLAMFGFHSILASMKLCVIITFRYKRKDYDFKNLVIIKFLGMVFIFFAIAVLSMEFLGIADLFVVKHGEIVMIAIATYVFTKGGFAISNLIKMDRNTISSYISKRVCIVELCLSILNLQRSMIATFERDNTKGMAILNIVSAVIICFVIASLGVLALIKRK